MRRMGRLLVAIVVLTIAGTFTPGVSGQGKGRKPRKPPEQSLLTREVWSRLAELRQAGANRDDSGRHWDSERIRTSRVTTVSPLAAATATVAPLSSGAGVAAGTVSTLVLYDSTGPYGWLGELYGIMTANLVSRFGAWTARPITTYTAGDLERFTAAIYVGSTYDEPIPAAFLDDVARSSKPVIWAYDNIWQLTNRVPDFTATYGWNWAGFDFSPLHEVLYKGIALKRYGANGGGIMNYASVAPHVSVLGEVVRPDGTRFPWALRSRNLTYIGELPLAFIGEGDRYLAFADLLFDALAPRTPERHRALVRIEDVSPASDPVRLRAIADYLSSRRVPFSVGVVPVYTDPNGFYSGGAPQTFRLRDRPALVSALRYMQSRGGTLVEHGWTHQHQRLANPYNGVSADDFEFYRVTENPDHSLTYLGPVAGDSTSWANDRLTRAAREFQAVNLAVPTIFEFPHYAGSAVDYAAVGARFSARYERSLYFSGLLSGAPIDYTRLVGQQFPYVVRDVYGTTVLPENLGAVEPEPWFIFPARQPHEIVADARRNLVVRDGFASFFFHPFLDIRYLQETVEGIQAAGFTFVSPNEALNLAPAPNIVRYARDIPSSSIRGMWRLTADATAAGGFKLATLDGGWSTLAEPLAAPLDYFDVTFTPRPGTPYRLWLRMRGTADSKWNESVWVQVSDGLVNGAPAYRIGTTSGLLVNLENCFACGIAGWGWQNSSWWLSQPSTFVFSTAGTHRLRIQVREDGVMLDQIVLSPYQYLGEPPGPPVGDLTIVPR